MFPQLAKKAKRFRSPLNNCVAYPRQRGNLIRPVEIDSHVSYEGKARVDAVAIVTWNEDATCGEKDGPSGGSACQPSEPVSFPCRPPLV